jgi:DNA-binding HxlR family transcriptional regulator
VDINHTVLLFITSRSLLLLGHTTSKKSAKHIKTITKRGTLEILIPLCCTTTPVRYLKFKNTMKGFSSKTLAKRLKELDEGGILERQAYNEIPSRVEYKLTSKG